MHRIVILLLLSACSGSAPSTECTPDAPCALTLRNVTVVANPLNVLSYFVTWETAVEASSEVDVDCGAVHSAAFTGKPAKTHRLLVMGLVEGARCKITLRSATNTLSGSATETIQVAELPEWMPDFTVSGVSETTMAPGWTLFSLGRDDTPLTFVIVDETGRVRWYHRRAIAKPGKTTEVKATERGLISTGVEVNTALIGWDGKIVWEATLGAHDEILPLALDRFFLIKRSTECSGDTIFEWERTQNTEPWSVRLCDLTTAPGTANAIAPFPGEDALLVSLRDQNAVIKIDRTTKQTLWVMGDNGDFTLPPAARFLGQHDAKIVPSGHILLFDNGLAGTRDYSRVLELAYDPTAKTAQVAWEFRPSPEIFTVGSGGADRLTNGNTLMTFGSQLIEVDGLKTEVWHLVLPPNFSAYRAHRVAPLTGVQLQ